MLLAIDSGNTNIVFAIYDGLEQMGEWRSSNDARRTADEYGVWLSQLMSLGESGPADVTEAIIATVVPETLFSLKTLCRKYFECEPLVVGEPGVTLGIEALVDSPDDVGSDRLVNAVAAHMRYGGPLIIVDFGTATTFDVVDGDGNYFGGIIAPGIMMSGVYWGYIGLIEGLIDRIRDEFGAAMTVVATGGLAPLFAEGTDVIEHLDPELTLRGLAEVHRRSIAV